MLTTTEYPCLGICCFGAVFCFIPLVALWCGASYTAENILSYPETRNLVQSANLFHLASFFVTIIPAADILLDIPHIAAAYFRPTDKSIGRRSDSKIMRLSESERFIFILGIALQSTPSFLSPKTDFAVSLLVQTCANNSSTLLILAPIVAFLTRSTETFTMNRTNLLASIITVAYLVQTVSYFFPDTDPTQAALVMTNKILTYITGFLYSFLIYYCAFKYFYEKLRTKSSRSAYYRMLFKPTQFKSPQIQRKGVEGSEELDSELYTNYIPALHMMSTVIIITASFAVALTPLDRQQEAYNNKDFIVLFSQIMVLVIELRIRKNEVARGLIALLESKKSYVRYISHELRTPLNTAFLGLKLLTGDLKASDDAKDMGRYDILCDVNMSCMAAVDILNDLLCYEKLESGILELHKENILVEPFLSECVSMFSAQARESNVSLLVVTENESRAKPPSGTTALPLSSTPLSIALPLVPDDTIFADKFKMDQVIRNLISNALKFTAPGGAVTVKASFVYRADAVSARSARKTESTVMNVLTSESPVRKPILSSKKHRYFQRSSATMPLESVSCQSNESYAEPLTGYLTVVVTDTGAGISKQNQLRLFKEIVQFSPEKLQSGGGSGLGLWITSGIMDLHNGRISVSSEGEGKGSSFTVEIPMIRALLQPPTCPAETRTTPVHMRPPSAFSAGNSNVAPVPFTRERERERDKEREKEREREKVREEKQPESGRFLKKMPTSARGSCSSILNVSDTTGTTLLSRLEVLVVDDSRLNRKMLLKCLQSRGHVCTEAGDGLEAIRAVKKKIGHSTGCEGKPFDAILMDFVMPNMDGPTATKEIRALGYTAPIFGVTGNGLPSDVTYFLGCGADKVLLKPLDFDAFGQAMRDLESEYPERMLGGVDESGMGNGLVGALRCSL